jgi:hypothetical protein
VTLTVDTYDQGYRDGRHHARTGKPALCSPTQYGHGFYDGWKSIRYPPPSAVDYAGQPRAVDLGREANAPLTSDALEVGVGWVAFAARPIRSRSRGAPSAAASYLQRVRQTTQNRRIEFSGVLRMRIDNEGMGYMRGSFSRRLSGAVASLEEARIGFRPAVARLVP